MCGCILIQEFKETPSIMRKRRLELVLKAIISVVVPHDMLLDSLTSKIFKVMSVVRAYNSDNCSFWMALEWPMEVLDLSPSLIAFLSILYIYSEEKRVISGCVRIINRSQGPFYCCF